MRSITIRNYRCFGNESQTARLAPLTLLVGENSSGKTSLLALIRALWDVAIADRVPDFKQQPYDLGSFDEIAHHRGARGSRAHSFECSIELALPAKRTSSKRARILKFDTAFCGQWAAPMPMFRRYTIGDYSVEQSLLEDHGFFNEIANPRGRWRLDYPSSSRLRMLDSAEKSIRPIGNLLFQLRLTLEDRDDLVRAESVGDSPSLTLDDVEGLRTALRLHPRSHAIAERPFASAPVRSHPQRAYDPRLLGIDPLGEYVPTYLAQLSQRDPKAWEALRQRIEDFGRSAGLFDEVRVRQLGKTDVDPFQIQVRKYGAGRLGPFRNLVDVGYGVSQILPVALELLRKDARETILLQQPEVHLHPSAQAALGSLLCETISDGRAHNPKQVIVETHSDFIVDRVRMAIVDRVLNPDDVSLVYFERRGLDVGLHSIRIDESGTLNNVPLGYRKFFLDELQRAVRF